MKANIKSIDFINWGGYLLGGICEDFKNFSFLVNTADVLVDFGVVMMSKIINELGFIIYMGIDDVRL